MVYLLSQISKYVMILIIVVYTFQAFLALSGGKSDRERMALFAMQRSEIIILLFAGIICLFAQSEDILLLIYFLISLILVLGVDGVYHLVYKEAPRQLLSNMCMLLAIGFIIQARLDLDGAMRQLIITAVVAFGMILVPFLIRKISFLDSLTWFYAIVGIAALGIVCLAATTSYGAKLSLSIAGISFQPSEFIKIVFVFFVAAIFSKASDFKTVVIATAVAALHVLILVASKDLGAALLYFMVYLVMLYVATRKLRYVAAGLAAGAAACVAAYYLFAHVRTRVIAWQDPFSVIDDAGYQTAQSLFAIGSGGWLGTGLGQGLPTSIPVVEEDFVFSAICEELGALFAICLVMICLCCYILILNIAMKTHRLFHKLIALGLGTVYIFQVFLTVGGATKFIPSTGVTLPFISIGGSSMMSTFLLFNIILGLYLFRADESLREEQEAAVPAFVESQKRGRRRAAKADAAAPQAASSKAAVRKKKQRDPDIEEPLVREVKISTRVRPTKQNRKRKYDTDRIEGDDFVNLEITIDPDEIEDYRIDLGEDHGASRK